MIAQQLHCQHGAMFAGPLRLEPAKFRVCKTIEHTQGAALECGPAHDRAAPRRDGFLPQDI